MGLVDVVSIEFLVILERMFVFFVYRDRFWIEWVGRCASGRVKKWEKLENVNIAPVCIDMTAFAGF